MKAAFQQWLLPHKIAVLTGILLLFATGNAFIFLIPTYGQLRSLHQQKILLDQQWQQQHIAAARYQKFRQDTVIMEYPYTSRLRTLHQALTPAALYRQIALLAKTHALQILVLKPQQQQIIANLQQQIFNLEMSGAEANMLSFLQLLMRQSWLLEIQRIEFSPSASGIHLQAILAAYYAAH